MASTCRSSILLIEPYCGGSHKQLLDLLAGDLGHQATCFTLPAKKWHWRARTSALYFAHAIPKDPAYRVLFSTSVLNLAELIALRPDLSKLKKVLYFHENQLIYPVRKQQERDFQFGYNQILSSLVADVVAFNSAFNRDSFLSTICTFFKLMPHDWPKGLVDQIRQKCQVLYFPLSLPTHLSKTADGGVREDMHETNANSISQVIPLGKPSEFKVPSHKMITAVSADSDTTAQVKASEHCAFQHMSDSCYLPKEKVLHIVWPHRWEHDKGPEAFFTTLFRLQDEQLPFFVSVLGETFPELPEIFSIAQQRLKDHILHWGYQQSKDAYFKVLSSADVVVSTAEQEFFGVAMLEAAMQGCYPLCPNRLVYPEIFPSKCLYNTPTQLFNKLKDFCKYPHLASQRKPQIDFVRFSWEVLRKKYRSLLQVHD